MADYVALHGKDSSLVLEMPNSGAPLWRYWGPGLSQGFVPGPSLEHERCHRGFHLDEPQRLSLFPGTGIGWFYQPAIEAHRNGRDFTFAPRLRDLNQTDDMLVFALEDPLVDLDLTVTLALDLETDVLTFSTAVANRATEAITINWLASAVLPLPQNVERVLSFGGRHAGEFEPLEDRLGKATWSRTNRRGITSHQAFPGAVALTACTSDHDGLAYAAQLAWSGNHRQDIEWLDDGRRQWQLGLGLAPGELILQPGCLFEAPPVHATVSKCGKQGAAANFHASMRKMVRWPAGAMPPRPVHFNSWEGSYFDHDEQRMMSLATKAAALGVERFVLDDGWFDGRHDDTSSLGDWQPDKSKYPRGLGPLAQHVVNLGMEFGLWLEPEMVNAASALFRAHPEWVLQLHGRKLPTGRNQLVLDLSRPAVSNYLFDALAGVLVDVPITYIKWDHNRALAAAASDKGTASYTRQTEAFYGLLDRLSAAFPSIEFESCAGGGGRIDMGVGRRVQRFWASDNIDALSRLQIQRGFLQFLPPEMMGSHIGTAPAHTTGRSQPLDFRAAVACQGHLGIELNLDALGSDSSRLAEWIAFYKRWRHILHGHVWTGTLPDGLSWHAAGKASEWLTIVYRSEPSLQRFSPTLALPFVDRTRRYAVSRIGPGRADPAMVYDGSWLAEAGLAVPPTKAERAIIFHGMSHDL